MTNRVLIKEIHGSSCEIYAIKNHQRVMIGKDIPRIEIYEDNTQISALVSNTVRHRKYAFSIVVCSDEYLSAEQLKGLMYFDLNLQLERSDNVYVPFKLYGVTIADLAPEKWVFEVNDYEITKKLMEF